MACGGCAKKRAERMAAREARIQQKQAARRQALEQRQQQAAQTAQK